MFNKVIPALLFCIASVVAVAQSAPNPSTAKKIDKPVVCDEVKKMITHLATVYDEAPVWHGAIGDGGSQYALLVNVKNDTWTFIQFDKQHACILGVGAKSTFMMPESMDLSNSKMMIQWQQKQTTTGIWT